MIYLTNLRKLAEAAISGPWHVVTEGDEERGIVRTINTDRNYEVAIATTGAWDDSREAKNAAYIAALSPPVVLAMLDVIEAAKDLYDVAEKNLDGFWGTLGQFQSALAAFEKEQGR